MKLKEEKMTLDHRAMILLLVFAVSGFATVAGAAPSADLWSRWEKHDPSSTATVDHTAWARFLDTYLVTGHPSGVNRVRYGEVRKEDAALLGDYLNRLQEVNVSGLDRAEQKAYWLNLYNALTVKVVVDHHPVESIRDIDLSSGLLGIFKGGPWKAKLVEVEGQEISLDDIEHRILRPIWKDNRIHYGVNCASIGCPNLQPEPFTGENTDELLEKGAREYVNHPRGAKFTADDRMVVSSIYDWFQEDFGGSEEGVLRHLSKYAEPSLAGRLESFRGSIDYEYDWSLNDVE